MAESVKVAVRVRPFNQREKDRDAKCCIKMSGKQTSIVNLDDKSAQPKNFAFDFSYWSHDDFTMDENNISVPASASSNYASQRMVFDDLGQGVLNNAYEGFNTSLFAYGQTGAGKSYSMVGYGPNKGIVPITCDELFKTVEGNKDAGLKYCVSFSMLEIYNEQVRDLLIKNNPKGGLPVRQNPSIGAFYVQGLTKTVVGSYKAIEAKMEEGTSNRTVASTNMNATSSRAHTVVTIQFDQIKKNELGEETKRTSMINLVDLAGSERAGSTGATGDRLKEGANINKSLSALGNVISALADASTGKKSVRVPYRDSVLTKLLQNALGGNSKTIMIAALSPADINFDETLSTLRYADRAKQIKNKAVVNENPMDKLIRELKEENDKLKKALGGEMPDAGGAGMTTEEASQMRKQMEDEIRAQMEANMAAMADMADTGDRTAQARQQFDEEQLKLLEKEKEKISTPHITNLNEDSQLSGVIHHLISEGENIVGRKDASSDPAITLSGLSIQKSHAIFYREGEKVILKPGVVGAKTKVNGQTLNGDRTLMHQDRILFGSNHMYVYYDAFNKETADGTPAGEITWDFAQKEIAQAKGFQTGSDGQLSKEQQLAQEQVLELLPMVSESNAISEELNKHKSFEVILISGAANPTEGSKGTRVMVKMKNLLNGNTWLWERGKFMNRRYLMQDMYQRYLDGDDTLKDMPEDEDPFWDPPCDVLIGTASAFLQALGYGIDMDDPILITDYKGEDQGQVYVNISPCDEHGKCMGEEYFVEDSSELLGKPYNYKITIRSVEIKDSRFNVGSFIKYKLEGDEEYTVTPTLQKTLSPEFNHSRVVKIDKVTQETLEFFENSCITFLLYGCQQDRENNVKLVNLSTKELRQREATTLDMKSNALNRQFSKSTVDEASALKAEILLLKRRNDILTKKEKRIQAIVNDWGKKSPEEQQFEPFYRAISAAAFNTGTMLKSAATVITKVIKAQKLMNTLAPNAALEGSTPALSQAAGSKACVVM